MHNGGDVLDHRSRKLIYNYILSNPGISFSIIRNVLDMNTSTLKYHLAYLERADKIYSQRKDRRRCYFCYNAHAQRHTLSTRSNVSSLTEKQQHILNIVQDRPGISNRELMSLIKINRKSLSYNIKKLGDLKLIWAVKTNGQICYEFITEEKLREEIFNQLVIKLISDEIDEETFKKIKKKLETLDIDEIQI